MTHQTNFEKWLDDDKTMNPRSTKNELYQRLYHKHKTTLIHSARAKSAYYQCEENGLTKALSLLTQLQALTSCMETIRKLVDRVDSTSAANLINTIRTELIQHSGSFYRTPEYFATNIKELTDRKKHIIGSQRIRSLEAALYSQVDEDYIKYDPTHHYIKPDITELVSLDSVSLKSTFIKARKRSFEEAESTDQVTEDEDKLPPRLIRDPDVSSAEYQEFKTLVGLKRIAERAAKKAKKAKKE
jgi:hypothetical protein